MYITFQSFIQDVTDAISTQVNEVRPFFLKVKLLKLKKMNTTILKLLDDIKISRINMLNEVSDLTIEQCSYKPNENTWSIQEVLEHLVLAERGGYNLICTAAECFKANNPVWNGVSENDGLSIEEIISRTWKDKEDAPESAAPNGMWSVNIWTSHFRNCDDLLSDLPETLEGLPLTEVIYPHFLCGPLNVIQRLDFIRFHIDRHIDQVKKLKLTI